MRKISKESKLYPILVIVALIFLLSINVAYAYFTSRSYVVGDTNFATLDVNWQYEGTAGTETITNGITINPIISSINRGETVKFKIGEQSINRLGFKLAEGSTGAYIRFWVDAYVVNGTNGDGSLNLSTMNYGNYFQLRISDVDYPTFTENTYTSNEVTYTNRIYYSAGEVNTNIDLWCIDSIKLLEDAPIDLLSKEVSLSISFEAVQSSNEAFKSVFNDWKGYSDSWS